MSINYKEFIHPADSATLKALQAVPGFDSVVKFTMKYVSEKMFKLQNTSSFLKLGPNQMPKIYEILLRVCSRLEIKVPELYIALDRTPNAYTAGDTDVFIVLHSGLIETMNEEQIETVIAHECGHILCHHVLYHTIGKLLLNCADIFINGVISRAIVTSLQYAFAYWMRCSEFSADRVSAYYHGSPEPVVDVMLALSGGSNNLKHLINRDEFIAQAADYKVLIDESFYNKALEFIMFGGNDHPLNAYRAYEILEFYKNNKRLFKSLPSGKNNLLESSCQKYNLRIKYEYNSKGFLSGLFDSGEIELIIDKELHTIAKNTYVDLYLAAGTHDAIVKNNEVMHQFSITLNSNAEITVVWDAETYMFTVKEG